LMEEVYSEMKADQGKAKAKQEENLAEMNA
jgi:hypothetical protein